MHQLATEPTKQGDANSTPAVARSGIDFRRLADLQRFKPVEPSDLGGLRSSIILHSSRDASEVMWESRHPPCEHYFPPFNKYVISLCLQDMPQIAWADCKNFKTGSFRKGETVVLRSGSAMYFQSDYPSHFLNLGFSPNSLRNVALSDCPSHLETPLVVQPEVGTQDPVLCALINALRAAIQDDSTMLSPLFLGSLTRAVCLHLAEHHQQKSAGMGLDVNKVRPGKFDLDENDKTRLMDYLYKHIEHPVSLADTTQALGISATKITRHFKQRGGDTFLKFFMRVRLARAHDMLMSGKFNATQASIATGFTDLPHFSRQFKRLYGVPPSTVLHR